nr:sodium-translocating pyrophosphatase [Labilithrix luteola]
MTSTSENVWMGFVLVAGVVSLVATALFARSVLGADKGTEAMQDIARAIREGAHAFLRRQYRTVAILAVVVMGILFPVERMTRGNEVAWRTIVAFVIGAVCSAGAGYWGMITSLHANVRVASASRVSVDRALTLALRGGAAAALPVIAGSLLGVAGLFMAFGGLGAPRAVPYQIVGFAFGASFVALFAQLGGGIYTKSADIGADLVGKVEKGIPEDDPRNPAVVADLVGDNVGDCAGRGADIFESASAETIGAMILGVTLYPVFGSAGVLFPLVAGGFGLLASIVGILASRMKNESDDPMSAMTRGHLVTLLFTSVGLYVAVQYLLGGNAWLLVAGLIGVLASFVFAAITRLYTGIGHRPVSWIAESSLSGPATNITSGFSVALESTALPVVTIAVALLSAYECGLHGLPNVPGAGLYGTAVATIGMLSTVGYVLSMDMFGPITDNAGGIVEMSGASDEARTRTDRLDAAGNVTKATTKGYAIGSATLAAFLLFSAYLDEVTLLARAKLTAAGDIHAASFHFAHIDIAKVPVFLAALAGATVVFVFSGLAIRAVVHGSHAVIREVRRQFHENPELMHHASRPDYARCVDIVTASALHGMIAPGILGVAAPVVVGLLFDAIAPHTFLGAEAVGAELLVGTIAGVLLGSLMNTGGGAWDNTKKFIESGVLGGKGSDAHKAAVVGDAVGDPLKDTAGPSLHVLIKLLGTVSLVTAPLFV